MTAPNRIYAQYADKPKAVAWYNITPEMSQQLTDGASQVQVTYDIETQEGVQLDIIGDILNAPRGTISSDSEYRLFLKAAIVRNNTDATIDDIVRGLNFIIGSTDDFELIDNEDMSFSIDVLGSLTTEEASILLTTGVVPKPQGVQFLGLLITGNLASCGNIALTTCGNITSSFSGFYSPS